MSHDKTLWTEGELVGYVTSGGWGYRLKAIIGLATFHRDGGVDKTWIDSGGFSVQVAGQRFDALVQLAPLNDPQDEKLRAYTQLSLSK